MTITTGATINLTLTDHNGSGNLQSNGASAGIITITGSGFPAAPSVIIYGDFSAKTDGSTAGLTDCQIGVWTGGHYASGIYPKYKTGWGGKTGMTHRQGGTDISTNAVNGFVIAGTAKKNFLCAYDMCVPSGRTFSGAATTNTLPAISTLKMAWPSDGALDSPALADIVIGTWIGSNFALNGNQCAYNVSGGSSFDFSGWNSFVGYSLCGASPFFNAGESDFSVSNVSGTTHNQNTTSPAHRRQSTVYFDVLTIGATYTVNINSVPHSYVAIIGDTLATIATSVHTLINAGTQNGLVASAHPTGSAVYIQITGLASAKYLIDFTCTVGDSKMSIIDSAAQYTHLSFPAYSGNGTQDLCQHLYQYVYWATSNDDTCATCLYLTDNAVFNHASQTIKRAVPYHTIWNSTTVNSRPSANMKAGCTHLHLVQKTTSLASVAL